MVHYNHQSTFAQTPPPTCPKCGSHRTEIVGRSQDGATVVLRCNACGERSRVAAPAPSADSPEAAPTALIA